jgi:VWFA-related protein
VQPTPAAPGSERQAPAEDEIERVDTDLTAVLLTAVDRDQRFVTNLRQEDIRVFENREPQQISTFERETNLPLSLAILVDTSASQERVLPDERSAARAFVEAVIRPDRDRAAIISFTGIAKSEQGLTNDLSKLHEAIGRVQVAFGADSPECNPEDGPVREEHRLLCSTGVWDAVWNSIDGMLAQTPERTRRAVILLSDGDDTSSTAKRREAIDFALKHNTAVYSIGFRDEDFPEGKLDRDALRKVSEQTGGRAFFPSNRAELNAAFAQINQELRAQYLVAYSPTNRLRDGTFRQIRIEVANPALRKEKLRLLYRQGYYARSSTAPGP